MRLCGLCEVRFDMNLGKISAKVDTGTSVQFRFPQLQYVVMTPYFRAVIRQMISVVGHQRRCSS